MGEWVIVDEPQVSNLTALSRREQTTFRQDDGRFVIDQHDKFDFIVFLNK